MVTKEGGPSDFFLDQVFLTGELSFWLHFAGTIQLWPMILDSEEESNQLMSKE